jgi:release factor glutamine methyltransferase
VQLRQALQAAIVQLESQLHAAEIGEARLQAEVLVFHVLGCDRAYLYAHPERELTEAEQAQYDALISRRAAGEPLQYLTGHQEFWKADFLVTPAVLIPRPETEHLIEEVLALVQHYPLSVRDRQRSVTRPAPTLRLRIIDVGTGSGAIAVTLARELPQAEVHAVDLSPAALDVARLNAERLGAHHVHFAQSDLLASVLSSDLANGVVNDTPHEASFDFVVSNPPYIGLNEQDKVQEVVKGHEPQMALFAGEDGLDVIRRLIPQAFAALRPGGWLLMEIGYTQSQAVVALLAAWHNVHSVADLAGIQRVIVARKPFAEAPESPLASGSRKITSIIFDMDGVLIDSESIHKLAIQKAFADFGQELTDEQYAPYRGQPDAEIMAALLPLFPAALSATFSTTQPFTVAELLRRKNHHYEASEHLAAPISGAVEFVLWARQHYKIALATSGSPRNCQAALQMLGLHAAFACVVDRGGVTHPKPNPEVFLKAAAGLASEPAECLVIEDSINGLRAAKAAGCVVVAITTSFPRAELLALEPDFVVDSFAEIVELLRR